jgi:hypothetical protein
MHGRMLFLDADQIAQGANGMRTHAVIASPRDSRAERAI